jgi:hydroxymethylglutaryl-CoA lyase
MNQAVQLIECPRDAMQGWQKSIPTTEKVRYINALLRAGFHTIDFGSFVSPRLIPQMADTSEVVQQLNLTNTNTKLLAIVANTRGANDAVQFEQIHYLGFPFSVSPTFQLRNTNSSPDESLVRVEEISELCIKHHKELVVYLSMGFGNPYGDAYNMDILGGWMKRIADCGVKIMSIADTVGLASPEQVRDVTGAMVPLFPDATVGVHLHAAPADLEAKLEAAFKSGCRRFDGAIGGIGGCPMAGNELVGNMDTLALVDYFERQGLLEDIQFTELETCKKISQEIFS